MLKLRALKGWDKNRVIELVEGENIIGRGDNCQIQIPVSGVSKRHAKITVQNEQAVVTDFQSSNGTFVNGVRVDSRILRKGDRIGFASVIFELVSQDKVQREPSSSAIPNFTGQAAAPQIQPLLSQAINPQLHPQASTQEQPRPHFGAVASHFIENTVLPEIYKLAENWPFKQIMGAFVIIYILLVTSLATLPMMQLTSESVLKESERRVLSLARNLASSGADSSPRVEAIEREEGVTIALLISNDGRILAPLGRGDAYSTSQFSVRARKANKEFVDKSDSKTIAASVPIKAFNPETGQVSTVAFAQVFYNSESMAIDSGRAVGLFARILVIAMILGLLLYFLLYKLILRPVVHASAQLDLALRGEVSHIKNIYNFPEFEGLINNVNAAIGRIQSQPSQSNTNFENEKVDRTQEAQILVQNIPSACFALDEQKRFVAANTRFEELTSTQFFNLQLQTTDALTDTALHLSVQELLENWSAQPHIAASKSLEIHGATYRIDLFATYQGPSQVAYYLVIIHRDGSGS